jgi:hypothetical protein
MPVFILRVNFVSFDQHREVLFDSQHFFVEVSEESG